MLLLLFLLGCKRMVLMIPNGASSSIDAYTNIHVYLSIYVYKCVYIYIYLLYYPVIISATLSKRITLYQDLVKKNMIPPIFHIMKKLQILWLYPKQSSKEHDLQFGELVQVTLKKLVHLEPVNVFYFGVKEALLLHSKQWSSKGSRHAYFIQS